MAFLIGNASLRNLQHQITYKCAPNIYFPVYPFKTANDDSDDEFEFEDNDDAEPPYPTYPFDRFTEEQARRVFI